VHRISRTSVSRTHASPSDRLRAAVAVDDFDRAADLAVEIGASARELLPEMLRPGLDTVREALAIYDAGDDAAARARIAAIGLKSPFLDWKLFVRGLVAIAGGDAVRALDNWSRLSADRLAGKIVAPLRSALDPTFRVAQAAAAQATLQRRGDRLLGGLAPVLRELQRLLARTRLDDAFRHAKALMPALKREMLDAVERVADCFRAAIITRGEDEDIERYRRLFGAPADDPRLARLKALLHEERHLWPSAHAAWKQFDESVADNPTWPAADRERARALVWCRMGHNAEQFGNLRPRLEPGAEACYRRAAELGPDLAEPQERLFEWLRRQGKTAAALSAGKRLVEQIPDHAAGLAAMADLFCEKGRSSEAVDYARRALAASPLDRPLRRKVAGVHCDRARSLAGAGKYAGAMKELAEAFRLTDGPREPGSTALAAVVAFKADDPATAEAHVEQMAASDPAAAYALLAESIRFKLPRALRQRFEKQLVAALGGSPTGPTVAALAGALVAQIRQGTYPGIKAHEKAVRTFVEASLLSEPSERDLVALSDRLRDLGWLRVLKKTAVAGQKRFPCSPYFPFFEAVAHVAGDHRSGDLPSWKFEPLLEKARRLAAAGSPDERLEQLVRELDDLRRHLPPAASFSHVFNEFLETFPGD
jgi:tetratricopeptide (TPR) repeat protein